MPTYVDITNIKEIIELPNIFSNVTFVSVFYFKTYDLCAMKEIIVQSWQAGVSFLQFLDHVKSLHLEKKVTGHQQNQALLEYSQLNERRMDRILKHGTVEVEQKKISSSKWLVITEGWCGDSAQITPYLYHLSLKLGAEMRVILRDDHPDFMDLFLTNGTRSIPIIVFLNDQYEVIQHWGPRPLTLVELIKGWKEQGLTKEAFNPMIHKWYADDKGASCVQEWLHLLQ